MDLREEVETLRASLRRAETVQHELDRRVFHLKTLYDVSKDIFGSVLSKTILRNFLLMTMGNFGVIEGFIAMLDTPSREVIQFVSFGHDETGSARLQETSRKVLVECCAKGALEEGSFSGSSLLREQNVAYALPFTPVPDCRGLLGLGPKLIGEPYTEDDRELLGTLVNNLVVALKNARSFEEIRRLNEDLQAKNIELEKALDELRAAMRKVEILESVKANLSKFVPTTVSRLIEKSPAGLPESHEQDVSVLFVDIEGYTKICESLQGAELNEVVEKYFSMFMDAIYANNGDVNETAGDGLMVIFHNDDEATNAVEAVRTALTIRDKAACIKDECKALSEPLLVNMGINSGRVLLGAAKFESYTGSRWTYTARGLTTNIAARLGALATGGGVLLSRATAERVRGRFPVSALGTFKLKNVSEQVEVFSV
ncbi:MAG TPA: adenylate/guanylate cyclase domain-containing protein [Syntrophobacteria bacterium]|nr:adenylate/guanylate cyclase domain-containing protein [Syntrophobacteria bacterium]